MGTTLLPELAEELSKRYQGVRIVYALLDVRATDRWIQQCIRFQAPLSVLKAQGLITEELLRRERLTSGHRDRGVTALGDGFSICEHLDAQSRPGCVDFMLYTGITPREYGRARSIKDAARVLRRIAVKASQGKA